MPRRLPFPDEEKLMNDEASRKHRSNDAPLLCHRRFFSFFWRKKRRARRTQGSSLERSLTHSPAREIQTRCVIRGCAAMRANRNLEKTRSGLGIFVPLFSSFFLDSRFHCLGTWKRALARMQRPRRTLKQKQLPKQRQKQREQAAARWRWRWPPWTARARP